MNKKKNLGALSKLKELDSNYKKEYNPIYNLEEHKKLTGLKNSYAYARIKEKVNSVIELLLNKWIIILSIIFYITILYPLTTSNLSITIFNSSFSISNYFIEINNIIKTFASYLITIALTHLLSK